VKWLRDVSLYCGVWRCSLVLQVRGSRSQVQQELREREEVEKELGLVKGWIQDTRGLLLSPTADLDSLLQDLEVGTHTHTRTHTQTQLHAITRNYTLTQAHIPAFTIKEIYVEHRCPI